MEFICTYCANYHGFPYIWLFICHLFAFLQYFSFIIESFTLKAIMKKLKSKVALLLSFAIIGITLITAVGAVKDYHEVVDARKTELKTAVESAHSIVAGYHKLEVEGKMTTQEAQKAAKDAVRMSRYGGKEGKSEYFYIFTTTDGMSVVHPFKPEWEGNKSAQDIKAPNGQLLIVDMIKALSVSKDTTAFVDTLFPRPGQQESVAKLQFVKSFEPWKWMVGSGLYMDDVNAMVLQSLILTGSVGGILLLIIVVAGMLVVKSVLRQIGGEPIEAIEIMKKVAQGDLTVSIPTNHNSSLLYSVNDMVSSLAKLVEQTQSSAQEIAVASHQISQGNMNLSVRTEQAAASLQETAASMHEIATSISSSAGSATYATQLTDSANNAAINGGKVMQEVMTNMDSIKEAAHKITDITSVIDSISFQTNLLALNAAVEAARAGEQGRGFAVVATEVRNLAQKSATAAKEIKALIQNSSAQVNAGSTLVIKASESMNEIVSSVDKVSSIINEINAAAKEQNNGISQVNTAVAQLDSMTQQNAALVEEAAAAAGSLNDQATYLSQLVDRFKTQA